MKSFSIGVLGCFGGLVYGVSENRGTLFGGPLTVPFGVEKGYADSGKYPDTLGAV